MDHHVFVFVIVASIFSAVKFHEIKNLGDICYLRDGNFGKCAQLGCCRYALELLERGFEPDICHYQEYPIVCCPDLKSASPKIITSEVPKRRSEEKCLEYTKLTYEWKRPQPEMNLFLPFRVSTCTFEVEPIIYGGIPAQPGEFPHMALLGYDTAQGEQEWFCGGSLISENFILTAAHCCKLRKKPQVVRLGLFNISYPNEFNALQEIKVKRIILHPDFHDVLKYNDVALLELEKNVTFTSFVRPACLNVNEHNDSDAGVAAGWGSDGVVLQTEELLRAKLHFIKTEVCEEYYSKENYPKFLPRGLDNKTQFCAGDFRREMRKDTCKGDSGGPLMVYRQNTECMYNIVGITSFGLVCGDSPGVYTRVFPFVEWIETIVWP